MLETCATNELEPISCRERLQWRINIFHPHILTPTL
jgi:hypothetical protein